MVKCRRTHTYCTQTVLIRINSKCSSAHLGKTRSEHHNLPLLARLRQEFVDTGSLVDVDLVGLAVEVDVDREVGVRSLLNINHTRPRIIYSIVCVHTLT